MMSQTPEKVIIEYSLEELRCSLCTAYLSCAPIQLLPDGSSVCGRCSVPGEEQTYRILKLEAILSKTLFPCRYKENGCEECFLFGHIDEHEAKCDYYNLACPCLADEGCAWEGPALQILDHFTKNHSESVVDNAEFKIQIDQDAQGLLIVPVNNATFALNFEYTANGSNLHYDIKSFTHNVQEASYKVKLINDADQNYYIGLKGGDCLPFNVYNMPKTEGLVLKNFLPILNNPNLIKVAVDFSVIISNKNLMVDNDLLQTARCKECQGYLIPPLFDCKVGIVCSNCSKRFTDSQPSVDDQLKERVAKANFPCNWIGCNFISRAADYQHHTSICAFRINECIITGCKETFTQEQTITHLEWHGYEYFLGRFVYRFAFKTDSAPKTIFTFKNNGLVTIQYNTDAAQHKHEMRLLAFRTDSTKLALKVQLAHEHCKLKSKLYSLAFTSNYWYFHIKLLPTCFNENEKLTVTLEVGNCE